jgi:diguanylate cyclase (GGDEF)-like protein/PAS domain S-box-containing protein
MRMTKFLNLNKLLAAIRSFIQLSPRSGMPFTTLQFEQVKFLYSYLPSSLAISALLALFLIGVQAAVISSGLLFGWSALIFLVLSCRAVLYAVWKRYAGPAKNDVHFWLAWFRVGAIAAGIIWGVGGVLLQSEEAGHKIYVSFVLAGLSAGAATTLAIDSISVVGFLLPVLLPQLVFLVGEGGAISHGMSAMILLYLVFLLASAHQSGRQLEENFYLRYKATENELQLLHMLENSPIATRITDRVNNQVVFANSSYIALIDSTPEQVIGVVPASYYAQPDLFDELHKQLSNGENVTNKLIELCSPDAKAWTKWVLASYFSIEYQNKPAILGWFYDITDRKIVEDQVEYMAYHDTLTDLPNRTLFLDCLKHSLAGAEREQRILALMFVDLDKFKPVNDQFGHHVGDLLLKAVAERIRSRLRKSDSVARIGGDEFVILLSAIKKEEHAVETADMIRQALNQPFEIEGININISSSTGVAIYPDHAEDAQQLIKYADIAMYCAKAEGKNCVRLYHPPHV